jgi:hypothetical protein
LACFEHRSAGICQNGGARFHGRDGASCFERLIGLPFLQRKLEVLQLRIRVPGFIADCLFHARAIVGALLLGSEAEITHQVPRRLGRTHLTIAPHECFRLRAFAGLGEGIGEVQHDSGFIRSEFSGLPQRPDGIVETVERSVRLAEAVQDEPVIRLGGDRGL